MQATLSKVKTSKNIYLKQMGNKEVFQMILDEVQLSLRFQTQRKDVDTE